VPEGEFVHIRQCTPACVTTITYIDMYIYIYGILQSLPEVLARPLRMTHLVEHRVCVGEAAPTHSEFIILREI